MKLSSLFAVPVLCFHLAREDSPIPIPLTNAPFRYAPICCLLCDPLLFRCVPISYHFTVCPSILSFRCASIYPVIPLCVYLSCRSAVRPYILPFRCASIYPVVPLCVHLSCRSAVRLSILLFRCAPIYPVIRSYKPSFFFFIFTGPQDSIFVILGWI